MKINYLSGFLLALLIVCNPLLINAKGGGKKDDDKDSKKKDAKHLRILGAEPNLDDGTLLISGINFSKNNQFKGKVKLYIPTQGVCPLDIIAFDPDPDIEKNQPVQELLVTIPVDFIEEFPGTYLLTVIGKKSDHRGSGDGDDDDDGDNGGKSDKKDTDDNRGNRPKFDIFYVAFGTGGEGGGESGPTGPTGPTGADAVFGCTVDTQLVDYGETAGGTGTIILTNTSGADFTVTDISILNFGPDGILGPHYTLSSPPPPPPSFPFPPVFGLGRRYTEYRYRFFL